MEEIHQREAADRLDLGQCLAPLGLSETDCLNLTGWVRCLVPGWHVDRHEDAFGQPSLILAPNRSSRLRLALIVYRINTFWFLGEVVHSSYQEFGDFRTARDLLASLKDRLEHWSLMLTSGMLDRLEPVPSGSTGLHRDAPAGQVGGEGRPSDDLGYDRPGPGQAALGVFVA